MTTFTSNDSNVPAVVAENTASPPGWAIKAEGGIGLRAIPAPGDGNVGVLATAADNQIAIYGTGYSEFDGTLNSSGILRASTVEVSGDIGFTGADCAEEFDLSEADTVEPGTVMALDQEGTLKQSDKAYDKSVAGVISGAGGYKPGVVLDKRESQSNRVRIALLGKVFCKVDARYAPIEAGDLLTTSPTMGYAMKADDPSRAFGAVIGKALRPLGEGQGLIPILISLQ
jgi:hypothetical protein